MSKQNVPQEYIEACTYPGRLDPAAVDAALARYLAALGVTRNVRQLKAGWSLAGEPALKKNIRAIISKMPARDTQAVRDAQVVRDARDAQAVRDAQVALAAQVAQVVRAAQVALDSRAVRDALDARDARDARVARDAQAAQDAQAAVAAQTARAAQAARDAQDAIHRFASWCVQSSLWWLWRWDCAWLSTYAIGARQLRVESVSRWAEPIYDAFLAGCWFLYWTEDTLYWVAKPTLIKNVKGQMHCATGPALLSDVKPLWFWNNVLVDGQIILRPETLTAEQIAKEPNAQVRQVMVERVGIERVCQLFKAKTLDTQGTYQLLGLTLGDGRVRPYLKMLNPSMPGIYHVEGVHPNCTTVQQALNWRNGFTAQQIDDEHGADWLQQGDVILKPVGARTFKSQPIILT
jgi:hypothetical protein